MKKAAVLLAILSFPAAAADSGDLGTCSQLRDLCTKKPSTWPDAVELMKCIGFVTGAVAALQTFLPEKDANMCVPSGVTQGQMAEIAVKWMNDNPDVLHLPASYCAVTSARHAFPCAVKK